MDQLLETQSKDGTQSAEQTIKKVHSKVFGVPYGKWAAPAFFGTFTLLLAKINVNANEISDCYADKHCSQNQGLNGRHRNGFRTAHILDMGMYREIFNWLAQLTAKEQSKC